MTRSVRLALVACTLAACRSRGSQQGTVSAPVSRVDAGPGTNTSSSILTVPPVPAQGCPATRADAWRDPGTVHAATIVGNETWTAEGSPHRLPHGATIASGASITLVPCALVLGARGSAMTIAAGGALFSMGEARRPIRIAAEGGDVTAGAWDGVVIAQGARATSRIVHTRIESGGAHGAGLEIAAPEVDLEHVSITDARGTGVHVALGGSFAAYALDVHVTATIATNRDDGVPVHFDDADAAGTLPTGDFHGNARDVIRIGATESSLFVRHTQTWRDPGVPYALDARCALHIDDANSPQLTLAPNVTLEMGQDDALAAGDSSHAALTIEASANNAVHLRARDGESWRGVDLGPQSDSARTVLHGVFIDGAAGLALDAQTCAPREITRALIVARFEPRRDLLADVTVSALSPSSAFVARAWRGSAVDLVSASARVSLSADAHARTQTPMHQRDGTCPRVVACPR